MDLPLGKTKTSLQLNSLRTDYEMNIVDYLYGQLDLGEKYSIELIRKIFKDMINHYNIDKVNIYRVGQNLKTYIPIYLQKKVITILKKKLEAKGVYIELNRLGVLPPDLIRKIIKDAGLPQPKTPSKTPSKSTSSPKCKGCFSKKIFPM